MGDDPTGPDRKVADRLRILEFQVDQLRRELERLEKRHAETIYSAAWHFGAPVRVVERAIRKMFASGARPLVPEATQAAPASATSATAPAKRILIDVTAIVAHDDRTGIQRVVRQVVRALYAEENLGVTPIAVRLRDGALWTCEDYVASETGRAKIAEDRPLSIETGDRLLMLDNSWKDFAAFAGVFAQAREKNGAIVSCIYDLIPQLYRGASIGDVPEVHLAWLKRALAESDGMIAISQTVAKELCNFVAQETLPHRAGLKVGWFHCGSDIAPAATGQATAPLRAAFDTTAPAFLLVGTLEPRKGHQIALAAFDNLWRENFDARLVLIGRRGWHVDAVIDDITAHPEFNRRLFWFDSAGDADLAYAYDHCAAALAPSYAEGFGLPIAEAAWRNRPALCSDIPVFREIGGAGALYFRVNDSGALASLIRDFLGGKAKADPACVVRPTWREAGLRIVDVIVREKWMRALP